MDEENIVDTEEAKSTEESTEANAEGETVDTEDTEGEVEEA